MSHSTNAKTNKQQQHPKVHFKQYLYNADEPEENNNEDVSQESLAELEEQADRYYMFLRRQIRLNAQRKRSYSSYLLRLRQS